MSLMGWVKKGSVPPVQLKNRINRTRLINTMKRFTLFYLSLIVAVVMVAADNDGSFFLRFQGQHISTENVVDRFSHWFSLPAGTKWREVNRNIDYTGMDRIVYRQYVGGVEVEHSQVILHAKNGLLRSANGMVMETSRTPVIMRTLTSSGDCELLLVNTPDGYRYAHKHFSATNNEWTYRDAETGQVIKRVAALRCLEEPIGPSSTVMGNSLYSGDVPLDVVAGDDGVTYLYDRERNIHTLNGAYIKTYEQMMREGTIYNYFPQGNMPDNPLDAGMEDFFQWLFMVQTLAQNNELEHLEDYIRDFSSYISSPNGEFSSYRINTLSIPKVTLPDGEGNLVPIVPTQSDTLLLSFRYGTDLTNISNGIIDDMKVPLAKVTTPLDITMFTEIIPKEGVTIIASLGMGDVLATTSFIPDASGTFEFENERISLAFTYESSGDPTVDVHWGMGKTLDFYEDVFGRKSYDGNGAPVYNLIYLGDQTLNSLISIRPTNAAALSSQAPYPMFYGMGGDVMKPVVELSVMAHEFTHIITGVTSNLEYAGEPGALNESFSDIMGINVKKYVRNTPDWYIGADVIYGYSNLRDMSNPKNGRDGSVPDPDTYGGENWVDPNDYNNDKGGIHANSGVQNKWYYLLTEGGSGTNDNGYEYSMEGIGIEKSRQIAYLTLTSYATEQSNYKAISEASIEAATVLFGDGKGQEVEAVINAWKAVGVIDPDGETAIEEIVATKNADDHYYDLQGRKFDSRPTVKGIYIHNGRKVIIR